MYYQPKQCTTVDGWNPAPVDRGNPSNLQFICSVSFPHMGPISWSRSMAKQLMHRLLVMGGKNQLFHHTWIDDRYPGVPGIQWLRDFWKGIMVVVNNPSLKLTFWHLKMDGWNTIFSFWGLAYFQGRKMLVSGSVIIPNNNHRLIGKISPGKDRWLAPLVLVYHGSLPLLATLLGSGGCGLGHRSGLTTKGLPQVTATPK